MNSKPRQPASVIVERCVGAERARESTACYDAYIFKQYIPTTLISGHSTAGLPDLKVRRLEWIVQASASSKS